MYFCAVLVWYSLPVFAPCLVSISERRPKKLMQAAAVLLESSPGRRIIFAAKNQARKNRMPGRKAYKRTCNF